MESGELIVSADAFVRISVFLIYLLVCAPVYRRLFPLLSPTAKRLATAMLVAQVLVIVAALEIRPSSVFESGLWDLDGDWNIPSTLASTQLVLAAGVALATAIFARADSTRYRSYLVGFGLLFLWLGIDESFMVHEYSPILETYYVVLGAAMGAATVLVAVFRPKRSVMWYALLLSGLFMSAFGALVVDKLPWYCSRLGFVRLNGCIDHLYFEEALEFLGIWLTLVAMLGLYSNSAAAVKISARRLLVALPALWVMLLVLFSLLPYLMLTHLDRQVFAQYEPQVQLRGYNSEVTAKGLRFQILASSTQSVYSYTDLGFSIHIVDQVSGASYAGDDEYWCCEHRLQGFSPVYREWIEVELPPNIPLNRALWIVLTLWWEKDGGFVGQKILESDHQLLSDTQIILDELAMPSLGASSPTNTAADFNNGFSLAAVNLPKYAQAGAALPLSFSWRSDSDSQEDYAQFLHLGHDESGEWWVYDQQPLGARLPTRLWYSGLADRETWQVPLPADLAPGRYNVFTGLYRVSDKERLPVSDADGKPYLDARLPLGTLIIE